MTKHPIALALALAFSVSYGLTGCDHISNLSPEEHIQRAKDLDGKGELRASIIELKDALSKSPDNAAARLLLGQVYLEGKMGNEAEKELSKAQQLGVSWDTVKFQLGEAWLLTGQSDKVLDKIQLDTQASPINQAKALQLRADALLQQRKAAEACGLFQASLEKSRQHAPTYWGLAKCAYLNGDNAQTQKWFEEAVKLDQYKADSLVNLGDFEQLNKNLQAAHAAYANALKIAPENVAALQSQTTLYLIEGKTDEAKKGLSKLTLLAPKSMPTLYTQGLFFFVSKDYSKASNALSAVLSAMPDHLPTLLLAGLTAAALNQNEQAVSYLQRFLSSVPHHAYAIKTLALVQFRLKQRDAGLATLAPLLHGESADPQAMAMAADAYMANKNPELAQAILEQSAKLIPNDPAILTRLGLSNLALGNAETGIEQLRSAANQPNSDLADTRLIMALMARKEYDQALQAIDQLEKKLGSKSAPLANMRGAAWAGKKDNAQSVKYFEQALSLDPSYFPAAHNLAIQDLRDNDPASARKRYLGILNADKNNLQAMLYLAEIAHFMNNPAEELDWLEKAHRAHPEAYQTIGLLASYHMQKGNTAKALEVAQDAAVNQPDNLYLMDVLGGIQLSLGHYRAAVSTFGRLTQGSPESAGAYLQLALALIGDTQYDKAREALNKALLLNKTLTPARAAQVQLEISTGNTQQALKLAQQFVKDFPNLALSYERLGDSELALKNASAATLAYEKAIAIDAGITTRIKLHQALLGSNPAMATQQLDSLLKAYPKDPSLLAYAANFYLNTQNNSKAIELYERIVQSGKATAAQLNNLAILYERSKDNRALPTAEQALKLAPRHPAILDTYGWILVNHNQAQKALPYLREAAENSGAPASLLYHYAVALHQTGQAEQSRIWLKRALASASSFPERDAASALLKNL